MALKASTMWACCCLILLCSISCSSCNFFFICNSSFFTSISLSDFSLRYARVSAPDRRFFLTFGVSMSSSSLFKSFLFFVWAKVSSDSWRISSPFFRSFSAFSFLSESSLLHCFSNSFSFSMISSNAASTGVNSGGAIPEPFSSSVIFCKKWDLSILYRSRTALWSTVMLSDLICLKSSATCDHVVPLSFVLGRNLNGSNSRISLHRASSFSDVQVIGDALNKYKKKR